MKQAAELWAKAAKQGNVNAQYELAECYYFGEGERKDDGKAIEWYHKAAMQGHSRAQYRLGLCYIEKGLDREIDVAMTTEWFRKAAECFQKAADQGDIDAQYNLAKCYELGTGIEKDLAKAAEWYRKAASQGDADAKRKIEEGIGK